MKKIAAVLALSVSTGAFAQQLGDLNYFQKSGSIKWNTDLHFGKSAEKDETATSKDKTTKNGWGNTVTYGLSDKLNLGLAVDYDFTNKRKVDNKKDTDSSGFSDFTILANHRLMDQGTFVDVGAALTLGLGAQKDAQNDDSKIKGNNLQGHHSLAFGVAAGQIINAFEWRANVGGDYHFAGNKKQVDEDSSTSVKTDGYFDLVAGLEGQYRATSELAVHAGLNYVIPGKRKSKLKDDSSKKGEDKLDSTLGLNAGVKYNLSSTLLLKADYSMVSDYNVKAKQDNSGAVTNSKSKISGNNTISVGAEFLF